MFCLAPFEAMDGIRGVMTSLAEANGTSLSRLHWQGKPGVRDSDRISRKLCSRVQ